MKRNVINKPKQIECAICQKSCSAYSISSHIKHLHKEISIDEYVNIYGEFRKPKPTGKRKLNTTICQICENEYTLLGMYGHLRDTHNTTPELYVEQYQEYRIDKLKILNAPKNKFKCLICKSSEFLSHKHFAHHIKKEHKISMLEYVQLYIFKEIPKCQCGCGEDVKLSARPPYKSKYISGHNPNGMAGKRHNTSSLIKMSKSAIKRILSTKGKDTKPELRFKEILDNDGIRYIKQHRTDFGIIDFYVDDKYLIEIDGSYWHPLSLTNLNIQLLQSASNDKKKNDNIADLIRIRENNIPEIFNINDIIATNEKNLYPKELPPYKQVILQKAYLKHLRETDMDQYKNLPFLILKLIRIFKSPFPKVYSSETVQSILKVVPSKIHSILNDNIFNNNCSNVGVEFIKSNSSSFWKSSYKGKLSPVEVWKNDDIMYEVIKYRIGNNKNFETFDISQHQLIRGISANRYTISFFKPVLAAAIYKHFLGDSLSPTVFDPCAGFGGRLLGFKAMYPNGTYIGIEPNPETFNELIELSKDLTDIYLFNCKIEDFDCNSIKYDIAFTSIPYYDLEKYSNVIEYESYNSWVNIFCEKIKSIPNLILNVPDNLKYIFTDFNDAYRLKSNSSHFSKTKSPKYEWLLRN